MYEEKGSITDAVIWFDNQIARAVAAKYPGKFVTILAYHSTAHASEEGETAAQPAHHLLRHRRVSGAAMVASGERAAPRP